MNLLIACNKATYILKLIQSTNRLKLELNPLSEEILPLNRFKAYLFTFSKMLRLLFPFFPGGHNNPETHLNEPVQFSLSSLYHH